MPWRVARSATCPTKRPWAVILKSDNSVVACHQTEKDAHRQLAALYASENGKRFDPHQRRDPHTGEWIRAGSVPGTVEQAAKLLASSYKPPTDEELRRRAKVLGVPDDKFDDFVALNRQTPAQMEANWLARLKGPTDWENRNYEFEHPTPEGIRHIRDAIDEVGDSLPHPIVVVPVAQARPFDEVVAQRVSDITFLNAVQAEKTPAVRGDLRPGIEGASELGLAAVLRHEYAHDLWNSMDSHRRDEVIQAIPEDELLWDVLRRDLSLYAAEETQVRLDRVRRTGAGFRWDDYDEIVAEVYAITNDRRYKPEDFTPWVNQIGAILKGAQHRLAKKGLKFNPHQPRDPHSGEWIDAPYGGGSPTMLAEVGGETESDPYRITHTAPGPTDDGSTTPAYDMDKVAPDLYEHPEWYRTGEDQWDNETMEVIQAIRGKPDAMVTIYRSTPHAEINDGDWITLSPSAAAAENMHPTDPEQDMPVVSARVRARNIWWDGNSLAEFGYSGPRLAGKAFNPHQPRDPHTGQWVDIPGRGYGLRETVRGPSGGLVAAPRRGSGGRDLPDVGGAVFSSPSLTPRTYQEFQESQRRQRERLGNRVRRLRPVPGTRAATRVYEPKDDLATWDAPVNEAFAAIDGVHGFPDGTRTSPIMLAPRLRTSYGDFNPYNRQIRLNPKATPETRGVLHELGHSLDEAMSRRRSFFASEDKRQRSPAMENLLGTIRSSKAYDRLGERPEFEGQLSYWRSSSELFARAYAQWVAQHGQVGDDFEPDLYELGTQWEAEDFKPISEAMEELMREQGLLR